MRIMGIDYGDERIGIAVSDPSGTLVGDAWTLKEWDMDRAVTEIIKESAARHVERLVLGFPRNMDGSEGLRCNRTRLFAEKLEKASGLPVVLWDERRSSVEAHAILHTNGKKEKKHRATVDAVAASLILESYLGSAEAKR
jgi:putative Holliday junction resolvase